MARFAIEHDVRGVDRKFNLQSAPLRALGMSTLHVPENTIDTLDYQFPTTIDDTDHLVNGGTLLVSRDHDDGVILFNFHGQFT